MSDAGFENLSLFPGETERMISVKTCKKCNIQKPLEEFGLDKRRPHGRGGICKYCRNMKSREWYVTHHEIARKKANARSRRYYENNQDKVNEKSRVRYKINLEGNRKKINERARKWRVIYPEKAHARDHRRSMVLLNTLKGRLNNSMRSAINQTLHGGKNKRHWETLVDFTENQLRMHLEKQFKFGQTWHNYGEWEIDHIIPISVFNFKKPEDIDFKRCWALKNLRPLWQRDNRIKNNKIEHPFQPSLGLCHASI